MRIWLTWFLLILGWIAALVYAKRASADELTPLQLGKIVAGEAGVRARADEVAAITAVLRSRADMMGVSMYEAARLYTNGTDNEGTSHHWNKDRTGRRAWIPHLNEGGAEPRMWPNHIRWSRYRRHWLQLLAYCRAALAGQIRARCSPHMWGCDCSPDNERAERAGWVEISCGDTRNRYWRIW